MWRVYLDMCCFNRPYDDQSQLKVAMETQCKLHIQNLIKERKLEMAASYMLRYECSYFISTDKRLLKYQTNEIKMVTPIEFVTETEAEQFISFVIREKFDYTKWQRGYFDRKTPGEISREASDFEQAHPFSGNAIRL